MGLFSRLGKKANTRQASDEVLLFHGMLLMVAADGQVDREEMAALESYFITIPEFKGKNFGETLQESIRLARMAPTLSDSIKMLTGLTTQGLRNKCFLLAMDIALASGDVDQREDEMLEAMQRVLQVPDELAGKIIDVLSLKYSTS